VIARYGRIELLCLDELGYIELDRRGAELLFQVFTEREEKSSIAVASNAAFSEWAQAFTDPRLYWVISTRCDGRAGQRGVVCRGQVSTTWCGYWPKSCSSLSAPSRKARRWRSPRRWLMS
jgi:IstB-like ATP binding protein